MREIPQDARIVFEWILYRVYQWDQDIGDGTTVVFEKIQRKDTAYILPITSKGEILLTWEKSPISDWRLRCPGGRVEWGEKNYEAAIRELREETGYGSDFSPVLLFEEHKNLAEMNWDRYFYIIPESELRYETDLDLGEEVELRPYSLEDFLALRGQKNSTSITAFFDAFENKKIYQTFLSYFK